MKFYIDLDLNSKIDFAIQINEFGYSNLKQDITKKTMFQKSLFRYMVNTPFATKMQSILHQFGESNNIEIIQKSVMGQDFRNFINKETIIEGKENNKLKNIAFIARFKVKLADHLVNANAIILTTNLVRKKINNGIQFYFNLVNVELVYIQETNYAHPHVLKLGEQINFINIDQAQPKDLLIESQIGDFAKIKSLKKAINIMEDKNDSLKLYEQKKFISSLANYLKKEARDFFIPYWIDDTKEKFTILENKSKISIYFFTNHNKEFDDSIKKEKWLLLDANDSNNKMRVRVKSYKSVDIEVFYAKRIDIIQQEINRNTATLKVINSKIQDHDIEIKDHHQKIKGYQTKIEDCNSQIADINKKLDATQQNKSLATSKAKSKEFDISNITSQIKRLQKEPRKINKNQAIANAKIATKIEKKFHMLQTDKDQKMIELASHKLSLRDITLKIEQIKEELSKNLDSNKDNAIHIKDLQKNLNDLKQQNQEMVQQSKELEKNSGSSEKQMTCLNQQLKFKLEAKNNLYKFAIEAIYDDRNANYNKTFEMPKTNQFDLLINKKIDVQFSNFDMGFYHIINRWNKMFQDYINGDYKSPYTLISLDKPNVPLKINEAIKSHDIEMNSLQQEALNAFYNCHYACFLQGPPGTGKTQVISASIINSINNGENIVLSSSTNEAINNAFDRIFAIKNNPNIFLLRYSRSQLQANKNLQYTSDALYKNFINNIAGYVKSNNQSVDSIDKSILHELKETKDFTKEYIPECEINDSFINNLTSQSKSILLKKFSIDFNYFLVDLKDNYKQQRRKLLNRGFSNETKRMDKFVKEVQKFNINYDLWESFDDYVNKFNNKRTTNNKFLPLIKEINRNFDASNKGFNIDEFIEEDQMCSKHFALKAFEGEAINVIGITTTSRLEIGVKNSAMTKELFTNYRVDGAIIDEISKSVSPEILSIARLAKRFMLAGDYRQLPPQFEVPQSIIKNFRDYVIDLKQNNNKKLNGNLESIFNDPNFHDLESYIQSIEHLFEASLFKNQVFKMKEKVNSEQSTSYVALKTQYRFNEDINQLVNLTYDEDEKLETFFKDDNEFERYSLGKTIEKENFIDIIDTSELTNDFIDFTKLPNTMFKDNWQSFDSNYSVISKQEYASKINDFNAYVIINILSNLHQLNPNLEFKDIGVIAMTRSQAQLIQELLSKDKNLVTKKEIKIDTVDNFQGREKKIIILDLVRSRQQLSKDGQVLKIDKLKKRNLDHYKSPERINVAVSRAKNKLIIVGAIKYLAKNVTSTISSQNHANDQEIPLFKEWERIVDGKKGIRSWKEF